MSPMSWWRLVVAAAAIVSAAVAAAHSAQQQPSTALWIDGTASALGSTRYWTNKVEIADLDGDGRPDLLFANGGDYSTPGKPEPNQVFLNRGPGARFSEVTEQVLGPTPDLARVIKARDLNGDGLTDIIVGTTYQTQSRLFFSTGKGRFSEVTRTHLPQVVLSVGDLEPGDVDADGDLDLVLADWGPGHNMTNEGGVTRLWLNDGAGRFTDETAGRLPDIKIRFSWDLELVDVDNDADLDVLVSCKRCPGGVLYRNDGAGRFADDPRALPQYTNNYEFEAMDLDGDGFLDLVTLNDGDIVAESSSSRREHIFRNDGKGRYRDATDAWWPDAANVGEDDNMAAFLDVDSDGDADFVIGSLSGPDRLLINDGRGRLRVRLDAFDGDPTPGTLGLALADLDGDRRMDVVQGQGEHPKSIEERLFWGRGVPVDTAPPSVTMVAAQKTAARPIVRARVHDRKSPSLPFEWSSVVTEWTTPGGPRAIAMRWYGEYLWRVEWPADIPEGTPYRVCATDAAGNGACATSGPLGH
jgi:hypothetical protein